MGSLHSPERIEYRYRRMFYVLLYIMGENVAGRARVAERPQCSFKVATNIETFTGHFRIATVFFYINEPVRTRKIVEIGKLSSKRKT